MIDQDIDNQLLEVHSQNVLNKSKKPKIKKREEKLDHKTIKAKYLAKRGIFTEVSDSLGHHKKKRRIPKKIEGIDLLSSLKSLDAEKELSDVNDAGRATDCESNADKIEVTNLTFTNSKKKVSSNSSVSSKKSGKSYHPPASLPFRVHKCKELPY